MSNNLFISYDLNSPGQRYEAVIEEIKSIGGWANVQKSLWYVSSDLTAKQVVDRIWSKMDRNDSLIVIDTTNNTAAWQGMNPKVAEHIQNCWSL